jgi:hypothetical protein
MSDNKATELQNLAHAIAHATGAPVNSQWSRDIEDLLAPLPLKNVQQLRHLFYQVQPGNAGLKEVQL